jgi:hypothetical protein
MTMATAPPNAKITVYMPADMIADLDDIRTAFVRKGISVDRGRLVRAALIVASNHEDEWIEEVRA